MQEDVSLRRLADHSFVSYHHLTDIFEQVENESIGGYIRRYRLEKAASLLLYTDHSLAIVAEKTGYTGSPSLSKAFAQHFHCSPGTFRRKPRFLPHSPNAILDGIGSAAAYETILTKEFSFQYRIETIKDHYTVCKPLKMVPAFAQKHFLYDAYLQTVHDDLDTDLEGRFIIRPFDSLNFAPASKFTMHHGKLITAQAHVRLSQDLYTRYVVTPVKEGQYLVFDIPPGPVNEHITNYTTLFRENLIGYKKLFHPEDFYIFLLLSEEPDKIGEFYMYYSPLPHEPTSCLSNILTF